MMAGLLGRSNAPTEDWQATEPWVRAGMRLVIYMLGGLLLFSILMSISGAVVATGSVTVEGNYKTVQHLDGGIVSAIHVKNGDRVKAGDVLITIDAAQVQASLGVTRLRVLDLKIQKARLEAERDGLAVFSSPPDADATDPEISKILAAQANLFNARRTREEGRQSVLKQRLVQLQDAIRGLNSQRAATVKQAEINARELSSVLPLFDKGYVNQQRVAPLQRESARLEGEIGRLDAEIAKINNAIGETELQIAQTRKDYLSEVTDELRRVEAQLGEQLETFQAVRDRAERTEIRAPVSGFVHGLKIHTEGGVLTAATPILQIIPEDGKLLIEARLTPQSIDKVRAGLPANVRFPAFDSHTTPRIEGRVVKVSPAELTDEQGHTYFTAQIEIAPQEIARLGRSHKLVPGMPAEVFIETASRSILSYLLKPLTDTMSRAFRES